MHNVRVMRNMMINSASHAFCNQPAVGGPVYWIRNIGYHLPGGSTRLTGGSAGVLFYNNTILSETAGAGHVERPLAQQPVSRRELGAGDLQRQHASPTTPRPTTTASGRIPARRFSFAVELAARRWQCRAGLQPDRGIAERGDARDAAVQDARPNTAEATGQDRTACSSTTTSS